jgi:hypothetical protein
MIFPKPIKAYEKITKRNAQEFFNNCMAVKNERIEWIRSLAVETGGIDKNLLNLSPESLVPLWSNLHTLVKMVSPAPHLPEEISDKPEWFHHKYETLADWKKDTLGRSINGYDLQSIWIMDGLAYYFGEVFCRRFDHFNWVLRSEPRDDMIHMPHVFSSLWPHFYVCPWSNVQVNMVRTWLPDSSVALDGLLRAFTYISVDLRPPAFK